MAQAIPLPTVGQTQSRYVRFNYDVSGWVSVEVLDVHHGWRDGFGGVNDLIHASLRFGDCDLSVLCVAREQDSAEYPYSYRSYLAEPQVGGLSYRAVENGELFEFSSKSELAPYEVLDEIIDHAYYVLP